MHHTGVFRSVDAGDVWEVPGKGLSLEFGVDVLAIDPISPSTLYAGAFEGVCKSTDGGGSWIDASAGIPDYSSVDGLAIDASVPATVYAGVTFRGV